ncbi:hypothetical protein JTE90_020843 [Oedothorax gibbosus]|uniref:OTU domain-containing protein n=1 Tax=Oedothorax gibbosus TaxID=931172 RepID=A0AAV6UQ28_9ARAC|nr:hypothetical protein JTE90_020843 [Oedothorax gibbosus]
MDKKKKTNPSSRRQVQSIHSNFSNRNKSESLSRGSRRKQNVSRSVLEDENSNDLVCYTEKSRLVEENPKSELTQNSTSSGSSEDHERTRLPNEKTYSPSKGKKSNRGKAQPDDPSSKDKKTNRGKAQPYDLSDIKESLSDLNVVKSSKSELNLAETSQEVSSSVKEPDPNVNASPPKEEQPNDKSFHHINYGVFEIIPIEGDGNCLFRCMAHYVLGNQEDHVIVRHMVVNNVCNNWDNFKSFVPDEDMEKYRQHMEENGTYGSEMEIVSFVDVFRCTIKIFFKSTPSRDPLVFGGTYGSSCYFLYSGVNDCGHYDVLQPTASDELQDHTEAVASLRRRLCREIEQAWNNEDTSFDEIIAHLKNILSSQK